MIEEQLIAETNKWLEKIEPIVEGIECFDSKGEEKLNNIKAYISDAKHFLATKDYVKAFEAVIYAWGIFETCLHLEAFIVEESK